MSAVTPHKSWSVTEIQHSLISLPPSAESSDIQGIPGLMHCKFFSIMNCVCRMKGMGMQHTLQRNASEGADEPKLAWRDLRMSDG